MASLMKAIVDPKKNWLAALHMKSVSNRLRKYGKALFSPQPVNQIKLSCVSLSLSLK